MASSPPPGTQFHRAVDPFVTLLFSPGMRQPASAYDRLGQALAHAGIGSLILAHDDDAGGGLPAIWRRRARDWRIGADWLAGQGIAFAVAGHSLGALCALAAGGARMAPAFGEFPVCAGRPILALAPPAPLDGVFASGAFATFANPFLLQIGRADVFPPVCRDWRERAAAWREARCSRALLVTQGADHYLGGLTGGTANGSGDTEAFTDFMAAARHFLAARAGAPPLSRRSRYLSVSPLAYGNRSS